jgi:hypothetical protein
MFYISLVIGIGCGFIASLMAFVITWNEYQRHQLRVPRLIRLSLQAAVTAFIFFLAVALLFGYVLMHFLLN